MFDELEETLANRLNAKVPRKMLVSGPILNDFFGIKLGDVITLGKMFTELVLENMDGNGSIEPVKTAVQCVLLQSGWMF